MVRELINRGMWMVTIRTRTKFNLGRRGSVILFLLMGILFLAMGAYSLSNTIRIINNGISVEAQVTNIKTKRSSNKTYYTPEIKFTTNKGEVVNTMLDISSSSRDYSVGDRISIIYSKDAPKDVILDTAFNKYGFPIILIGAGVISLILCALTIFRGKSF